MPVYMVERQFAEALELSREEADRVNLINDEEGVNWFYSFLSADLRRMFCLYEAPSADHIRRAAARAGIPADKVEELTGRVERDGALVAVEQK